MSNSGSLYANNQDTDQLAHQLSLTSAFLVSYINHIKRFQDLRQFT